MINMEYLQIPTGDPVLDKHLADVYSVDWASTPLGPLDQWPQDVAVPLDLAMRDPSPRLLLFGQDCTMIYNPAYAKMAGELHPKILGMSVFKGWPEQADVTRDIQRTVIETRRPHVQEAIPFLYKRQGYLEEVLLTWTTIRLNGPFAGFSITLTDVTAITVAERRRDLLQRLSGIWKQASNVSSIWSALTRSIIPEEKSFPFALVYSGLHVNDSHDFNLDAQDASHFSLEGFVGQSEARPLVQKTIDLVNGADSVATLARKAIATGEPQLMEAKHGTIPDAWSQAAKDRAHGDALENAIICPIRSNRTGSTIGLLVLGLNTRRPWSETYSSWISQLGREINDVVSPLLIVEDASRRQREAIKQTEREQALLASNLAARQREASDAQIKANRLLKVIEGCDVGVFEFARDGTLLQANVRL